MEQLQNYDAVLLVHPDMDEGFMIDSDPDFDITQVYDRFKEAERHCTETNIPLLVNPMLDANRTPCMSEFGYGLQWPRVLTDHQTIVNELEKLTGKPADQINLAIGGFQRGACVANHAYNLNPDTELGEVQDDNPYVRMKWLNDNRRIGVVDIIDDLTDAKLAA